MKADLERLRVVVDPIDAPITRGESNDLFREEWRKARYAYVDLLQRIGSPLLTRLVASGKPIDVAYVKLMLRDAQAMANATAAINLHLSKVLDLYDRVAAHEKGGQ